MDKRKTLAPTNLGEWFDRGEGRKLDRLLGEWLKEYGEEPCKAMAWKYMLVNQFSNDLDCALGHPLAWLRHLTVDVEHFENDPRLSFLSSKADDILNGVLEWTLSDHLSDILCTRDDICRKEFLRALFWCTGSENGFEGIDQGL